MINRCIPTVKSTLYRSYNSPVLRCNERRKKKQSPTLKCCILEDFIAFTLYNRKLSLSPFQYIPFHLTQDVYHEILLGIHSKLGNALLFDKSSMLKECKCFLHPILQLSFLIIALLSQDFNICWQRRCVSH